MKAIVLAAGDGSRLGFKYPKSLIKVCCKTVLEHQIHGLRDVGIDDIYVVTGYGASEFTSKANYIYNDRYKDLENSYSLLMALDRTVGHPVAVIDGDVMFDYRNFGLIDDSSRYFIDTGKVCRLGDVGVSMCNDKIINIGKNFKYGVGVGITTFSSSDINIFYNHLKTVDHSTWWVVYLNDIVSSLDFKVTYTKFRWCEVDDESDYNTLITMFNNPELEITEYATMDEIWSMYRDLSDSFHGLHLCHRNELRDRISWTNSRVFSARLNGRVVGLARCVSDGAYYSAIYDVMVRPEYQNSGVGFKLCNHMINIIKKDNPIKIHLFGSDGDKFEHFYGKLGFRKAKSQAYEIRYD